MEFIKKEFKQPTTTGLTQGYWNAQTNVPDIISVIETGYMWYVSISGNTLLGEIDEWNVGDWATKNDNGWGKVINGVSGSSGNTLIIPDLTTGYSTNINLVSNATDWGFFDAFDDSNATGATGVTISAGTYIVSGSSSSRLSELRKFTVSGTLEQLYFTSTNPSIDGLDIGETITGYTANTYVYYLGGITYIDYVTSGETISVFLFESSGYTSLAFVNLPIIKNEDEQNIISKPIVNSDVFIIRDELSAFENNYRLKNIKKLTEILYYAGGAHFNIIENT